MAWVESPYGVVDIVVDETVVIEPVIELGSAMPSAGPY